MSELMSLGWAILVSSVVVFFASFVSWMLLPFHKADWKKLPDEEGFFKTVSALAITPGQYLFPSCDDPSKMKDPEYKKQWEAGPHGNLTIAGAVPNFGRNLLLVFIFYVVVGIFVGYIAIAANPADKMAVCRITGTAAILAYTFGSIPNAIFFGKPVKSVMLDVVDGFVYGLLTGIVFALMWPFATAA